MCPSFGSQSRRRREELAPDALRLLHQQDADDRRWPARRGRRRRRGRAGSVAEMAAFVGATWARMTVNSPRATSADPAFRLWRRVKPPTLPAAYVPPSLPTTLRTTASAISQPSESSASTSMERPKTKKKRAAKMSRKLRKRSSISCRRGRVREDHAGHEGADRLGEAELVGDRAHPDQEREGEEEEELARHPLEEPVDRPGEPARGRERGER